MLSASSFGAGVWDLRCRGIPRSLGCTVPVPGAGASARSKSAAECLVGTVLFIATCLIGIPSIPSHCLGKSRAWMVPAQQQAQPGMCCEGKEGCPHLVAGSCVFPLPCRGLPGFSVANLGALDVTTSGLCVSPARAQRLDELLLFVSSPLLTVPSIPAFLQTMLSCSQATIAGPIYFFAATVWIHSNR